VRHPDQSARATYVREVVRLYLATPGVLGRVRRADQRFAGQLFDEGVPLYAVQRALTLAAARRIHHNGFSTPLSPIYCLAYFAQPIREVLTRPPGHREIDALRETIARYWPAD